MHNKGTREVRLSNEKQGSGRLPTTFREAPAPDSCRPPSESFIRDLRETEADSELIRYIQSSPPKK
jgi:hypothetical protein